MGGVFLEGEFFRGPLLLEKIESKIRPKNSGPNFGHPKFVSQNSALESSLDSGSGGAKSPVQMFVPDEILFFQDWGPEGRSRRNDSLAIPHRKSFAAIPSVSLLHGHTSRTVSLSHGSRREITLI